MNPVLASLAVTTSNFDLMGYAENLANELGLPLILNPFQKENTDFDYFLVFSGLTRTDYQLGLVTNEKPYPSIIVDFATGKTGYRIRQTNTVSQPLAKAIGLKQGKRPHVIDATAGMGRDAAVLAKLGSRIHLIERSPVMSALLEDGLRRLSLLPHTNDNIGTRMQLSKGDAILLIPEIAPIDVIYLDPMYPKRSKQVLVKKEMRFARNIVGDDPDITQLLTIALHHAQQRVVVKRPRSAPKLSEHPPSHTIYSKNTRFDVYIIN